MSADPHPLFALGVVLLAFVLATAAAYWLGRRDEKARTALMRAEWDKRAWLAGRQFGLNQAAGCRVHAAPRFERN